MNSAATKRKSVQDRLQAQGPKRKGRVLTDKVLTREVRLLVPESEQVAQLVEYEQRLDSVIERKRVAIQEVLKKGGKSKRQLRVFISNTHSGQTTNADGEINEDAAWTLKIEGKLQDDGAGARADNRGGRRKFTSYLHRLIVELDKKTYQGDDNVVEWHRSSLTNEGDGFEIQRKGSKALKATILLQLLHQPEQFRLQRFFAEMLGVHTCTRADAILALWEYIKSHGLQDKEEREFVNCDAYVRKLAGGRERIKLVELPAIIQPYLLPAEPAVMKYEINVDTATRFKQVVYDVEVDVDDSSRTMANNFLLSATTSRELERLDDTIAEGMDAMDEARKERQFMTQFAEDPQRFILSWLSSQSRDTEEATEASGVDKDFRDTARFNEPWAADAMYRYLQDKAAKRRVQIQTQNQQFSTHGQAE